MACLRGKMLKQFAGQNSKGRVTRGKSVHFSGEKVLTGELVFEFCNEPLDGLGSLFSEGLFELGIDG